MQMSSLPNEGPAQLWVASVDEDRFAAPDDFEEEQGYEYYEMDREYEKTVRYHDTINMMVI